MVENYREIIIKNSFCFKNYRYACKELNEEIRNGKSKVAQLENWNRFFSFHKKGNSIVVDEVRDISLPIINKRKKIKGKWTCLAESILHNEFKENNISEIKGSKKDYLRILGLCSPLYLKLRYKNIEDEPFDSEAKSFLKAYDIDYNIWLNFCLEAERCFTAIISNAFKSLEAHNIITVNRDEYVIVREKFNANGSKYLIKEYANKEELDIINRTSEMLAEQLTDDDISDKLKSYVTKNGKRKFSNTQIMYIKNSFQKYRDNLKDVLESALDCQDVYRVTTIGKGSEFESSMTDELDYERVMTRMMDKVCCRICEMINNLYEKHKIDDDVRVQYFVLLQEILRDKSVLDDDMYSGITEMYFC